MDNTTPKLSAKKSINSKPLWVILDKTNCNNSVINPKAIDMKRVINIDLSIFFLSIINQNKRKENPANIPACTILSK